MRRSARSSCSTPRRASTHWKARRLDLAPILLGARRCRARRARYCIHARTTGWTRRSTSSFIGQSREALETRTPVGRTGRSATSTAPSARCSATRSPGVTADRACPTAPSTSPSTARPARASARSCRKGITMRLYGDANDYVGKGLSGGRIVVRPRDDVASFVAEDNIIARQRDPLRRHQRRGVPAGMVGRAVRGAQLRRARGGGGRRRPRLRVHDRRTGGRARAAPAATSRPACPAAMAYVYDPDGRACRTAVNPDMVELETLTRTTSEWLHEPASTKHVGCDRFGAAASGSWPTGEASSAQFVEGDAARTTGACWRRSPRPRGRRPTESTRRSWQAARG